MHPLLPDFPSFPPAPFPACTHVWSLDSSARRAAPPPPFPLRPPNPPQCSSPRPTHTYTHLRVVPRLQRWTGRAAAALPAAHIPQANRPVDMAAGDRRAVARNRHTCRHLCARQTADAKAAREVPLLDAPATRTCSGCWQRVCVHHAREHSR
eukprot:366079-Chlamydomonas_euryale.AAC.9